MAITAARPGRPSKPRIAWRTAIAGAFAATVLACAMPAVAGPAAALAEREYADAVQSFRAGRTSVAFGQFMALAQRGDVDSARIALFLYSYGPVLYGKQWDVLPADVAHWNTLVRNSTSTVRAMPEFPLTVLQPSRTRAAAVPARPAGIKNVTAKGL
jgi:hypothetical protein